MYSSNKAQSLRFKVNGQGH